MDFILNLEFRHAKPANTVFGPGMWKRKRLNFGGSGSISKKEAESELGNI